MKTFLALAFTTATVLSAAAFAQSNPGQQSSPAAGQTLIAPYTPSRPEIPTAPRPLFKIGKLPTGIWAPVEPPYDSRANRTGADNPEWWNEGAF